MVPWYHMVPSVTIWYHRVPYVALPKLSGVTYTPPIRNLYAAIRQTYTPKVYARFTYTQPIRQAIRRDLYARILFCVVLAIRPSHLLSIRPSGCPSVRPSDRPTIDFPCLHRSLQLYADLYVRYTPLHAVYDLYAAIRCLYADIGWAIRRLYADIRYTPLYARRPSILASPPMVP